MTGKGEWHDRKILVKKNRKYRDKHRKSGDVLEHCYIGAVLSNIHTSFTTLSTKGGPSKTEKLIQGTSMPRHCSQSVCNSFKMFVCRRGQPIHCFNPNKLFCFFLDCFIDISRLDYKYVDF